MCNLSSGASYANAKRIKEENGKPFYELVTWPKSHECVPSTTLVQSKQFLKGIRNLIEKNPTQSIGKCYKTVCTDFTSKMTKEEKMTFLHSASLQTCNGNLYRFRNRFVPKNPSCAAEFDTTTEWFLM